MAEPRENHIEWYSGADTMTLSLTQARYITRVRRILKKNPLLWEIVAENPDGSICAHISLRCLVVADFGLKTGGMSNEEEEEEE